MSDERRDSSAQGRRILVIANETVAGAALHQAIRFRVQNVAGDGLVVVPVLGSLAGELVARARSRFGVPVLHVVVRDDDGPGHGGGRARRGAGGMLAPTLAAS
jgi:hypothetical protein